MKNDKLFQEVYDKAYQAGMEAGRFHNPRPMAVGYETELFSGKLDTSRNVEIVNDGVCGFAWINIKSGNSAFANFLKRNGLASKDSYYGGVTVWVSEFGQSYERKMAFASAFANVVSEALPTLKSVYASGRLD